MAFASVACFLVEMLDELLYYPEGTYTLAWSDQHPRYCRRAAVLQSLANWGATCREAHELTSLQLARQHRERKRVEYWAADHCLRKLRRAIALECDVLVQPGPLGFCVFLYHDERQSEQPLADDFKDLLRLMRYAHLRLGDYRRRGDSMLETTSLCHEVLAELQRRLGDVSELVLTREVHDVWAAFMGERLSFSILKRDIPSDSEDSDQSNDSDYSDEEM
jgi:hypothetical protein